MMEWRQPRFGPSRLAFANLESPRRAACTAVTVPKKDSKLRALNTLASQHAIHSPAVKDDHPRDRVWILGGVNERSGCLKILQSFMQPLERV